MFKRFSDWLPTVTVAALIVTALFNIGFFGTVGIHFLGVMDLTNLAYTFGLSFGLILIAASLTGQHLLETHGRSNNFEAELQSFSKLALILRFILVGLLVIQLLPPVATLIATHLNIYAYNLFIVFSAALLASNRAYLGFRARQTVFKLEVWTAVFFSLIAVLLAGVYTARSQIFHGTTYKITSKSGSFDTARIVRSSSSGFLIATDGLIRFIPAGEITEVVAHKPVTR